MKELIKNFILIPGYLYNQYSDIPIRKKCISQGGF